MVQTISNQKLESQKLEHGELIQSFIKPGLYLWPWLLSLLVLCLLTINPAFAESKSNSQQEAEMAALYEQAFGKKASPRSNRQVAAVTPPTSQNADMEALYAQAFGKKKPTKSISQNSSSNPSDLSALYAKAFGKKPTATPSQIDVDFRVNGIDQGEVTLYSNQQGEIATADTEQLLKLLKEVIKEHIFERVKKQIESKKRVSFKKLTSLGMKGFYNSVNLSLDLEIGPSLRKPRVLSLRSKKKAGVRDENKITASEISAFLNMYSNVGIDTESEDDVDLKMRLEGSVNVGGVVLETSVDLNNKEWDTGRTTLTYDKPDDLKRFVVGHISTGNRNFQENLQLKGFRVSKEFFMDPEIQIRPKADESFVLETDSEVEVYINNRLQQRFYLDEGVYSLEDIGLYDGANDIRVRIKDAFGKITEKSSRQFYDSHLLKPELSLFAISVGILSNKEAYINDELVNEPIFSGYYQKGLSKNLTMSLDTQISPDSYLLGAEAIASVSQGSIKQSFGISGGKNKDSGYAARFEFRPHIQREVIGLDTLNQDTLELDTSIGSFVTGWTLSGEYRSEEFRMINEVENINSDSRRLQARLQTQFGFALGQNWRGNINLGVSDYYDSDKNVSAALTASRRFNNGVRWSVGAHYDSDDDFSVNMQLAIPLFNENHRRKKELDLLVNSKDNSYESRLRVKPLSRYGKNSLETTLEYQQNDTYRQQQLDLEYRDTRFETQLTARNRTRLSGNESNGQRFNVGFNTSLACIGKDCAVSYPIDDSFALVTGPSNQEMPIAINNGASHFTYSSDDGLPDNYVSIIPRKGSKAVVPLSSYRYQRVNIDESTLPDGYDSDLTEFEVFPEYHQGFLIKAGGEPATIVDGILVDASNKPLGFKGGQWVPQAADKKAIAFFSNKVGRFRMPSVSAGRYKLELFDYPDMQGININVPDTKGKVFDTGNLKIRNY